jgi:hypothetical protein
MGGGVPSNNYVQKAFRGRNDDGGEIAATWKADKDVDWYQLPDENFRIRFCVQLQGAGAWFAGQLFFWWSGNPGWQNSYQSTSIVRPTLSPHFVDGIPTTEQLDCDYTFQAGLMDEGKGYTAPYFLNSWRETEVEHCLELIGTDVSPGDYLLFQQRYLGNLYGKGYEQTPRVTVPFPFSGTVYTASRATVSVPVALRVPTEAEASRAVKAASVATRVPTALDAISRVPKSLTAGEDD